MTMLPVRICVRGLASKRSLPSALLAMALVSVCGVAQSKAPPPKIEDREASSFAAPVQWAERETQRLERLVAGLASQGIVPSGTAERAQRLGDFAHLLRRIAHERGQAQEVDARIEEVLARLKVLSGRLAIAPHEQSLDAGGAAVRDARPAGPPANDTCEDALPLLPGASVTPNTEGATADVQVPHGTADVWYRITQADTVPRVVSQAFSAYYTLSLYGGCPATAHNTLAHGLELAGTLIVPAEPGVYWLQVATDHPGFDEPIELVAAGRIRGQVRDLATGQPIDHGTILTNSGEFEVPIASDGTYDSGPVRPGLHPVTAVVDGYMEQHWPDQRFPLYCDADDAPYDFVTVESGEEIDGIDFELVRKGSVTGKVTRASDGAPVAGAEVTLQRICDLPYPVVGGTAFTDASGRYRIDNVDLSGVPPFPNEGDPYFAFVRHSDFGEEAFFDTPCRPGCGAPSGPPGATPLRILPAAGPIQDVDFVLDAGGSISGHVTDRTTGEPLVVKVEVFGDDELAAKTTLTDADGFYRVGGLSAFAYHVRVVDQKRQYVDQIYPDTPCPVACGPGAPIDVSVGESVDGIDFALDRLGSISGRITTLDGGPDSVAVEAFDGMGHGAITLAESEATYTITGLPPSDYFVRVYASNRFADEVWDDQPCPLGWCDPTAIGTPITVGLSEAIENIDFRLDHPQCLDAEQFACLGGRFLVHLEWQLASSIGTGHARRLTDDSAAFWFFHPNNLEVVVKVLDACNLPSHSFWIFAAGLTNVGTTLVVLDTVTGTAWNSLRGQGDPFPLVVDTRSFAICDAVPP